MKKRAFILIIICLFAFLLIGITSGLVYFYNGLGAVNENSTENVEFVVNQGEATNTIIHNLKVKGLIKNEMSLKMYAKMNPGTPQAGTYILTTSMDAKEIYESLLEGKVTYDTVWVTFVEGKRLTDIASVIASNFDYTEEEVMSVLDDKEYIKTLIDKYDILTDDILNDSIYHPLEGYLFPDTYEFLSTVTIEEIIEKMLGTMESKLSAYSSEIEASNLSLHEIMTLASIVELEGARSDDRQGVAGVFYNRLNQGISLGSDVTTYYAVGKNFSVDLTVSDLNSCNGYNTRGTCVSGLPVGPIANMSLTSIKAVLEPEDNDYLFFVADKNGKTYFSKTYQEHVNTTNRLKSEGLWYEY